MGGAAHPSSPPAPSSPPSSSPARDRYLDAALALLDAGEPLTLHRLGDALGLTHTAVYRHFPDLTALVGELASRVLIEALTGLPQAGTPRDRLRRMGLAVRGALAAHPALASAVVGLEGTPTRIIWLQDVVASELRVLGVPADALPVVGQALEGLVLGASAYDFSRAPEHLALRAQRLRRTADPAVRAVGRSAARVAANNEAAFVLALDALLDAAERLVVGDPTAQ